MAQLQPTPEVTFVMLGEATALMAESALHKDRTIAEVGGLILPPLMLGQVRIWRRGGLPVALATWAWLDEKTERAVLHENHVPDPEEWNNGSNPVVIDFIAPFGDGFATARDLKRTVFPERALRSVRRDAKGRVLRIVQHPGLDQNGRSVKARAFAA
ncbi:Hemolysin-activating lysine-acyltransferase HlyC [Labrenzia sp. THAF82]|uniref:toxin-activating lysine-acyltransferase n=1 Tax=Labrenzia sp. THAF82 TaxID=2587861 RepID=UPI0012687300|nr:toxin-activating lysine-acyltransferase [Labrenzia sp. THAF82]QFT32586.1 Hemolysin-activating lysine-acyltransferase HlyC [Labrenzia sp. THAF82]